MIKFQIEKWNDALEGMRELWASHWDEVANDKDHIKLNVWEDAYADLEKSGQLLLVTARDGEKIVGYHYTVVRPHLHYKDSLTAYTDVYFLHPDYREGMNGVTLFIFVEQALKKMGVQKIYTASKVKMDKSAIFERLGYILAEKTYTKYIGD